MPAPSLSAIRGGNAERLGIKWHGFGQLTTVAQARLLPDGPLLIARRPSKKCVCPLAGYG